MKLEIISYLAETTSQPFSTLPARNYQDRFGTTLTITSVKLVSKIMTLSFLVILMLFIPETKASWLTNSSAQDQWPEVKHSALTEPIDENQSLTHNQAVETQLTNHAELFQKRIKGMAEQLFANLSDNDPQSGILADGLTFTVFADLKKLTRTSSFGRYLSEQLMAEFQQQGFPVVEVRKSNSIMVMEKRGEYGLSRDLNEISTTAQARTMLTGTYTVAGDKIMVNAKIIDNANATLLSSATVFFEKNDLTETLLADSASAYARKDSYVYMKKLEL